jgi:RNA polymerase sigma-70 factor (ECF subfamily)
VTEQELAKRCARGDNEARKELYELYGARLLALCRRYAGNAAEAEDMMQDAFVKIFRVIGRFQWTRPGSLYSWMARVALNLAFDSARKRRRLAAQLVDADTLAGKIPDEPGYGETLRVPADVLQGMIAALPEGYRTVFELYCIEELSHKEIAALLGIKEKSSSASLARARGILARAIQQYLKGDGPCSGNGSSLKQTQ